MEWLDQALYWHWLVLAVVLVILETFSPGVFFIWMGVGAAVVALVLFLLPDLGWELQLLLFALTSVLSVVLWRLVLNRHPTQTDQPRLNRRGEQYIGRVFTLENPIVNGGGKIKVDDSTWKVEGDDCDAGTRIRVVDAEGVVLKVEIDAS
ncbi:MAG: NfeD family protein [Gammaproteobacteria bacterium]|nr:NfeD family protein [Gammaproteobacteria bacterium]